MTLPLGWDEDPDALERIFDGAIVLTAPLWAPCWLAGWLLSLPAALVRRWRR